MCVWWCGGAVSPQERRSSQHTTALRSAATKFAPGEGSSKQHNVSTHAPEGCLSVLLLLYNITIAKDTTYVAHMLYICYATPVQGVHRPTSPLALPIYGGIYRACPGPPLAAPLIGGDSERMQPCSHRVLTTPLRDATTHGSTRRLERPEARPSPLRTKVPCTLSSLRSVCVSLLAW